MAGRVEEDAKRCPRLMFGSRRAEFEHCLLRRIEIVDHDVDVHLLGHVLAWPLRRPELLDTLEADALV
jgi:hypothetical protein